MEVAQAFISLGIKGTDKSLKALTSADKGLKDVKDSAIGAKVAILGTILALERITAAAGARGMALQQFTNATGLSAEMLQKWQYAGKEFGVQAEDMAGAIKSVQGAMTDMMLGKGAPAGMGLLARVGFDPKKARDTFYVMQKLSEFAKIVPPDIGANILKGFGISENMFQFLRMNTSNIEKLRPSNLLSDREVAQLAKVDVAWTRFWDRVKGIGDHAVAKHGLFAIDELNHAISGIERLGKAFSSLSTQFTGFSTGAQAAGLALAAVFAPMTTAIAGLIYLLGEWDKKEKNQPSIFGQGKNEKIPDWMKGGNNFMQWFTQEGAQGIWDTIKPDYGTQIDRLKNGDIGAFLRGGPNTPPSGAQPKGDTKIETHIHTDAKNPKEHAAIVNKEINVAMRQLNVGQVV